MTCHPRSSHRLSVNLGDGLWAALSELSERTGDSLSHIVRASLSDSLDLDHHTIYQVSTSGALVQGVYQGCVKVADLLRHGDFGLGTFEQLDGEGIMLDGQCWQARSDGTVIEAPRSAEAPFWAATFFSADVTTTLDQVSSWKDLTQKLDHLRRSDNLFCAIRVDGVFDQIQYRVACRSEPGMSLVDATSHQAEFQQKSIRGSLVGFWTPDYARTINVPGYHLHFISEDRLAGGHILDLKATKLEVSLHLDDNVHLALPETPDFLAADLSGDPAEALAKAENKHS